MTNRPEPNGRNDEHQMDYSKINEYLYIGSNLCKGGVCLIHGEEFKKIGVCTELNLTAEEKEYPPDDIDVYAWLPVVDGYAPTPDQLLIGTSIINESIKNKNTVYVHCKNGHGRSPTMVAAYLVKYEGKSIDEAIGVIKNVRPEVHIEDNQLKSLTEFVEKNKSK